jgi:hypothetical protein
LRQCVEAFLVELEWAPARWGALRIPASAFGVALAAHNCLIPAGLQPAETDDASRAPLDEFTAALIATLPPARERDSALAYHAVVAALLRPAGRPASGADRLRDLLELSPLTALAALDVHTPLALHELAADLLPGWTNRAAGRERVWDNQEAWVAVIAALLAEQRVARWLRRGWLALPETRAACRNLGLVLEALRRRGRQRDVLLEFYEAYDYFCAQKRPGPRGGEVRVWPVLDTIETLLRTPGEHEAAIRINRRGNEYFLKFRPLLKIIIAENGLPSDYALLTPEFVQAVRSLVNYVTEDVRQRITFGEVAFEDERQ